jgi:hypothetical protein
MLNKEIEAALTTLESQLNEINEMLKEVSDDIIQGGFSEYPIFVAHQEDAKIGELIIDRSEFDFPFSINATVMERLIELNILTDDRKDQFIKAFGDTSKNMCILWLFGQHSQFIFMPFKKVAKAN